jgi:predicted acyltransferase
VPAIVTTVMGVLTGHWLRGSRPPAVHARGLLAAGTAGVAVGLAWSWWLPINKSLWTSSYAVFTAGAALIVLAACYWMIELRGWTWWTPPFVVLGVNALAVFFLSTLLAKLLVSIHVSGADGRPRLLQAALFDGWFAPWAAPVNASLAWALANVLLWLAVTWALFRKDVRLTV